MGLFANIKIVAGFCGVLAVLGIIAFKIFFPAAEQYPATPPGETVPSQASNGFNYNYTPAQFPEREASEQPEESLPAPSLAAAPPVGPLAHSPELPIAVQPVNTVTQTPLPNIPEPASGRSGSPRFGGGGSSGGRLPANQNPDSPSEEADNSGNEGQPDRERPEDNDPPVAGGPDTPAENIPEEPSVADDPVADNPVTFVAETEDAIFVDGGVVSENEKNSRPDDEEDQDDPDPLYQPCPGYEAPQIYPVKDYDGNLICPEATAVIYYVNSSGSDANDGLSINTPLLTPSRTINLMNANNRSFPGSIWVVFRRGDTFSSGPGIIRGDRHRGGSSAERPLVFTGYGPSTQRPLFRGTGSTGFGAWGNPNTPDFGHLIFSGLDIRTLPGLGGIGMNFLYSGTNITVEDTRIEGYGNNIFFQQVTNPLPYERVMLRGNIFDKAASGPGAGGHAQNVYTHGTRNMIIEDNIFDHGGYYGPRNTGLSDLIVSCRDSAGNYSSEINYVSACPADTTPVYADTYATIFNHNMYLNTGNASGPTIVRNNLISRASSHGVQARAGGNLENNIFSRNPLAAFVGYAGTEALPGYANTMSYNVVLEGNDITSTLPRGFGLEHNTSDSTVIERNIIANTYKPTTRYNKIALNVVCTNGSHVPGTPPEECSTKIRHNIVYNWEDHTTGTPLRMGLNAAQTHYNGIEITDNIFGIFADPAASTTMIDVNGDTLESAGSAVIIRGNTYANSNLNTRVRMKAGGTGPSLTYPQWVAGNYESNPTGLTSPESLFPSPCRTLATYYDDVFLGNTANDNCTIMHDDTLYEYFMAAAIEAKNRRAPRDPRFDTANILAYIRAGFTSQ